MHGAAVFFTSGTGHKNLFLLFNNGDVTGDTKAVGCIVGDLAGVESKIESCSYGGHVNGVPGSIQNAVGSDERFE